MQYTFRQNELVAGSRTMLVYLSTGGTPVTGKTDGQVTKKRYFYGDGLATESTSGLWAEVGEGWYVFATPASYLINLGPGFVQFSGSGFDTVRNEYEVVSFYQDINVAKVNSITVNGNGSASSPWGP